MGVVVVVVYTVSRNLK